MNLKKGKISSIKGNKVIVELDDDFLTDEIYFIGNEYMKPAIAEDVICLLPEKEPGICMRPVNLPVGNENDVYFKKISDSISIRIDDTGTVIITGSNIKIISNVEVIGNVSIDGTLSATGKISAEGTVLS